MASLPSVSVRGGGISRAKPPTSALGCLLFPGTPGTGHRPLPLPWMHGAPEAAPGAVGWPHSEAAG